jgi:hypothetical protein
MHNLQYAEDDKIITELRTAVDNDGTLYKETISYNDIFNAFRLALKFYHLWIAMNTINLTTTIMIIPY